MEPYNPKKVTYTITVKMTGSPWNWNINAMVNIMKITKAQAIMRDLDKIETELTTKDLTETKKQIKVIFHRTIP